MGSVVDYKKETNQIVVSENEEKEICSGENTVEADHSVESIDETTKIEKKNSVVFVLGGPGGGKSTQCSDLSKQIGYTHLSSGDLLRKASKTDPENGPMIERMIKEGESVTPDMTMGILMKAMDQSGNNRFLLDGFPRDEEIRAAFKDAAKTEPELVLFFDCSEEERERRILSRNQGRVDDNPESLGKRFKYFEEHTLPVVDHYRSKGNVYQVDAGKPREEVFEAIKGIILSSQPLKSCDDIVEAVETEGGESSIDDLEKEISAIKL